MASAEFVECEEIEIGHLAPLKKPKTTKGGKVKAHERVCSAADLEQSRASIRGYLSTARVGHGRPVCGIERSERVAPRPRFSASMASQLKTADYIGGQIDGLACGLDYHVMPVTPEEVRGALCGNQRATDDMVDAAITSAISGFPKRSNPHKRDAAAVALYCGRKWLVSHPRVSGEHVGLYRTPPGTHGPGDYGPDSFGGSDYP
jgi:hypothetical protein